MRRRGEARRAASGFTLIEMLAVVLMFGLIAALVMPNIDLGGSRAVRDEANDLASAVEFARQRAVMTGRTHQVVIEIDRGEHWIEWAAPPEDEPAPEADADVPARERKLDLVPPPLQTDDAELVPVPGEFGRVHAVDDKVAILGVERGNEVVDRGRYELRVGPDGAAEPASILVGDTDGGHALRIEVEPLADAALVVDAQ